ncbi:amino acid ABC transporter substrate-binding protein [Corynebacterium mustelae]|uniref:Amino acid ABC transporter substrate-binding protein n=1 Tax=Corynebacterium mustelae TaxID=571915 RepID=A0A0G3H0Q6_9CORY|nr:glutamate ABC transporter substrate-binding protein [Corynebacterium mustelae]AKK07004.1 amino acid ABC transporter substrate-binding protein [Corynebacterium mustelae]
MHLSRIIATLGCTLIISACAQPTPLPAPTPAPSLPYTPLPQGAVIEKAGTKAPRTIVDTELLGSLAPDDKTPEERVPHIIERGRLIVGVDQSQNLLSFRDTAAGELQGFEIDLAKEIARDIFGDPNHIEFRFVDSANWVASLESKTIDIAIRTISITRHRQDQVSFSTPYLAGNTRILTDKSSLIKEIGDLHGRTICVTNKSTGADIARRQAPTSDLLVVRNSADCLIALQQNQANAVITDDTILSGIAAQDPFTTIIGKSLNTDNYGIAIAKPGHRHHTDGLIRQVNATLERTYTDGTWQKTYNHWFGNYLPNQTPPATKYRTEPK